MIDISKIPQEVLDKAKAKQAEINKYLADFPMGVSVTLVFAIWHVEQTLHLEKMIDNLREENKTSV